MAIVHIHVERTAGLSLQQLYAKEYPGSEYLWYSVRDGLFAPYHLSHDSPLLDPELQASLAVTDPDTRAALLAIRTESRRRQAVPAEMLAERAEVVLGHFALSMIAQYLPPEEHTYRTVVRDPLQRMLSQYAFWRGHKGDVGHRATPDYKEDMSFEAFALHPRMINYQTNATGEDCHTYDLIGVTEHLDLFARAAGLSGKAEGVPQSNHFKRNSLPLQDAFIGEFYDAHAADYRFYRAALAAAHLAAPTTML